MQFYIYYDETTYTRVSFTKFWFLFKVYYCNVVFVGTVIDPTFRILVEKNGSPETPSQR